MKQQKTELYSLLKNFYAATGIGCLCFDRSLEIAACVPSKELAVDFHLLGLNKATALISEIYAKSSVASRVFYTFVLENNLICNIVMLINNNAYTGALVTQPVFVKQPEQKDFETILERFGSGRAERKAVLTALQKVPSILYERLVPLGKVLSAMAADLTVGKPPVQLIRGRKPVYPLRADRLLPGAASLRLETFGADEGIVSDFYKIRDCIQQGEPEPLAQFLSESSLGSMPLHRLHETDFVRSFKNIFIKSCALGCYSAISANAPFERSMDLADDFIRQVEGIENIDDIYELMKAAMVSFARLVAASRGAVISKPVRQVLSYIQAHYREKITLEVLAEHTGLSTFYLSSLISRETGMSLADNINKIRIEHGKTLLLDSNLSVLDAARQVGFTYQNHFASVFKKYTGFTPSEYRKTAGRTAAPEAGREPEAPHGAMYRQLLQTISKIPKAYDFVRIVEPLHHRAWTVGKTAPDAPPEICYSLWGRNEACKSCSAAQAHIKSECVFKLERNGDNLFLLIAAPIPCGERTYVVKFIKKASDIILFQESATDGPPLRLESAFRSAMDELTGVYSRVTLVDALAVDMMRCRLEGKPCSIVMALAPDMEQLVEKHGREAGDSVLKELARALSEQVGDGHAVGRYEGSTFLASLPGLDLSAAKLLAEAAASRFAATRFAFGGLFLHFKAAFCAGEYGPDMRGPEELIRQTLIGLYLNGRSKEFPARASDSAPGSELL